MALQDQIAAASAPDTDNQDPSTMSIQDRSDYYRKRRAMARGIDPTAGATDPDSGADTSTDDTMGDIADTAMSAAPTPTPAPAPTPVPGTAPAAPATSRTPQSAYLAQPPSDSEVRSVLQQIQALKRNVATPADQSQINQAEADARNLYHDQADRAQWMGVAEKLGNAFIKLGQAGAAIHHNVDVSSMKDLPTNDWEKQIDRYAQDYSTNLGALERQRQNQRQAVQDQNAVNANQYEDQLKGLDRTAGFEQYKYGQESSDYRRQLQDEARDKRLMEMEQFRTSNANNKQGQLEDKQLRNLQASDLQKQLAQAQDEQKSAITAASLLSQQDDISPKSVQKLETTTPGVLGKAGITPEQLQDINNRAQKKGLLWDSTDPETKNKLIQQEVLAPKQAKIDSLRAAIQHLYGTHGQVPTGGTATPDAVTTAPAGGTGQSGTVRVVSPNGQTGSIPAGQLQQALASGYKQVQ